MNLEKRMLVTLTDNKEYIVMTTIKLNNVSYVYLVENEKMENIKLCVEETENGKIALTEVTDMTLRQKLIIEIFKNLQEDSIT